jgi:hypothetical protein
MKKEDKELLLEDLCGRLPYGVKCQVREDEFTYIGTLCRIEVDNENGHLLDFTESMSGLDCQVYLSEVEPYLFPLSSMTSEQLFEVSQIIGKDEVEIRERFLDIIDTECHVITYLEILELLEWFYKNHFDIYGLIEQGLAIDATGLNIY